LQEEQTVNKLCLQAITSSECYHCFTVHHSYITLLNLLFPHALAFNFGIIMITFTFNYGKIFSLEYSYQYSQCFLIVFFHVVTSNTPLYVKIYCA
jgi:hypothetical protein